MFIYYASSFDTFTFCYYNYNSRSEMMEVNRFQFMFWTMGWQHVFFVFIQQKTKVDSKSMKLCWE